MMGGLMTRAASLGVNFSKIAAVGNEADLGVGEIGSMLVDDDDTDVILLFLETIRNPNAIAAFANAAHAAGKADHRLQARALLGRAGTGRGAYRGPAQRRQPGRRLLSRISASFASPCSRR